MPALAHLHRQLIDRSLGLLQYFQRMFPDIHRSVYNLVAANISAHHLPRPSPFDTYCRNNAMDSHQKNQNTQVDMLRAPEQSTSSRRMFLQQNAMGIGSVALAWILQNEQSAGKLKNLPKDRAALDLKPKDTMFPAQARAMISLFQHGGPAHMDLTDPKPDLSRFSGTDYMGDIAFSFVNEASKKLLGSPWKFRKHGQCGTELSELLPHTASIVDDICLIRSMHTGANGHEVSIRYFHGGIQVGASGLRKTSTSINSLAHMGNIRTQ